MYVRMFPLTFPDWVLCWYKYKALLLTSTKGHNMINSQVFTTHQWLFMSTILCVLLMHSKASHKSIQNVLRHIGEHECSCKLSHELYYCI